MTTSTRFERQLPDILEDLYLGPSPDYRDEVLATATRTRQRPAWAIPGRWLPMAEITSRPTFIPRLPLRSIMVALIVIALLVALAVAFVGSRQTRLPAPFGPARNGQIVYAAGGDIFKADPVTGVTRAIVTGPEMDGNPRFSRDGTRIAFMRRVGTSDDAFNLMIATSDGYGPQGRDRLAGRYGQPLCSGRRMARSSCSPTPPSASTASRPRDPGPRPCSARTRSPDRLPAARWA